MTDGENKVIRLVEEKLEAPGLTEDALALNFTLQHGEDLRYVAVWSRWLMWDGCCWKFDETIHVFDLARQVCRDAAANAKSGQKTIAKAATVAGVEKLAKADRSHAAAGDQWALAALILNTGGDHDC